MTGVAKKIFCLNKDKTEITFGAKEERVKVDAHLNSQSQLKTRIRNLRVVMDLEQPHQDKNKNRPLPVVRI